MIPEINQGLLSFQSITIHQNRYPPPPYIEWREMLISTWGCWNQMNSTAEQGCGGRKLYRTRWICVQFCRLGVCKFESEMRFGVRDLWSVIWFSFWFTSVLFFFFKNGSVNNWTAKYGSVQIFYALVQFNISLDRFSSIVWFSFWVFNLNCIETLIINLV